MNRDLKNDWQYLKQELRHSSTDLTRNLDWIDATRDYTRGRVGSSSKARTRFRGHATEGIAPSNR